MPVQINEMEIKALAQQAATDASREWNIANLTNHIRALWHHVARLERNAAPQTDVVFRTGEASITLKRDGTIILKGKDITIEGWGNVSVKASSVLSLKGATINEN
jgi:hypothetical protein